MPRTAALKPEQVPADSKPTLDTFIKDIGITPNMMATFALSPIAFIDAFLSDNPSTDFGWSG